MFSFCCQYPPPSNTKQQLPKTEDKGYITTRIILSGGGALILCQNRILPNLPLKILAILQSPENSSKQRKSRVF